MDKRTIETYGWIIVATLIVAVFISFATPFGRYVGQGFSELAKGIVNAGKEGVSEDNFEKLENEFNDKITQNGDCVIGDVNQDGKVDSEDELKTKMYLCGWDISIDTCAADINQDQVVSIKDFQLLSEYVQNGKNDGSITQKMSHRYKSTNYPSCWIGDINEDQKIDGADLNALNQILSGGGYNYNISSADVNWDGVIDANDTSILNNYTTTGKMDKTSEIQNQRTCEKKYLIAGKCIIGDIDENGIINNIDLGLMQQYMRKKTINRTFNVAAADINDDGKITGEDTILLHEHLSQDVFVETLGAQKTVSEKTVKWIKIGDMNGDGKIDQTDGNMLRWLVKNEKTEAELDIDEMAAADIDTDKKVTYDDYELLKEYLNGVTANAIHVGTPMITYLSMPQDKCSVGDLNEDGKVNMYDMLRLQQFLNRREITIDIPAADINNDGKVSLDDTLILEAYLAHHNIETHIQEKYFRRPKTIEYDTAEMLVGDVYTDGAINNKDLGVLKNMLYDYDGTLNSDINTISHADVNLDGTVNEIDLVYLEIYVNTTSKDFQDTPLEYIGLLKEVARLTEKNIVLIPRVNCLIGDVNNDDRINNKDLVIMQQYINGWDVVVHPISADINKDGKINIKDLGTLENFINKRYVEENKYMKTHAESRYILLGDINNDGKITEQGDATPLSTYVNNTWEMQYTIANRPAADINKDGKIDGYDYSILQQYITQHKTEDTKEVNTWVLPNSNWVLIGDITDDGIVDIEDYNAMVEVSKNNKSYEFYNLKAADVDKKGGITEDDLMYMEVYLNIKSSPNASRDILDTIGVYSKPAK